MNKDNIVLNFKYKSYKLVCEVMEEIIKSGNSKKAQLEEWSRYFNIKRDGNGYIFLEKYEVALPKIDNRANTKGNNNLYGKYIEKLVLDILVDRYQNTKERKIYSSKDKMLKSLSMVNSNYSFGKFNRKTLGSYISADIGNIKEFYLLNNKNLTESVERAFNSLANKCLVNWQIVTTVAIDVTEDDKVIIGYDNKAIKVTEEHRTANDEERDIIIHMESLVLEEMGLEGKKDAFLQDRYKEFNDRVCKLLRKNSKIQYYYKSYDVIFHEKVVKELEKINTWILEQEERQQIKITLNGIISNGMIENAKKRHLKAIEEIDTLTGNYEDRFKETKIIRRNESTYVSDNSNIIDTVINYKTRSLVDDMIKSKKDKDKKENEEIDTILDSIVPF
jgi:hypothetical protein